MMRLIIPVMFALVGAAALAATHAFEDNRTTHGDAFIALLAASHAAATAEGNVPALPARTGGVTAAAPPQNPAR
jgi:hypothetical protein